MPQERRSGLGLAHPLSMCGGKPQRRWHQCPKGLVLWCDQSVMLCTVQSWKLSINRNSKDTGEILLIRKWSALTELISDHICSVSKLKGRNNYLLTGREFWPTITFYQTITSSSVLPSASRAEWPRQKHSWQYLLVQAQAAALSLAASALPPAGLVHEWRGSPSSESPGTGPPGGSVSKEPRIRHTQVH